MPTTAQINARYLGMRPSGYLTPDDELFGESLRGRANEIIGGGVAQARAASRNRLAQRGITGAAEEQVFSDIEGGGAVARARASQAVGDTLAGIRDQAADFERDKVRMAWGADLRQNELDEERKARQRSAWWNHISAGIPALMGFFGGGLPMAGVSAIQGIAHNSGGEY